MDWMSPMDASFLHIEGPDNPMHIGGVSIFEGPAPPFERFEEMVAAKLAPCRATARRCGSCRSTSAGRCGSTTPTSTSPITSGIARCRARAPKRVAPTVARIFAQHLDRRKPLWEIWMVEGLSENRWALLSKVHHCMVDGVSATDLMTVMFEDAPAGEPARTWSAGPEPSGIELVVRTLQRQATSPAEQLRVVRAAARRPRQSLAKAGELVGERCAGPRRRSDCSARWVRRR